MPSMTRYRKRSAGTSGARETVFLVITLVLAVFAITVIIGRLLAG